MKYQIGQKLWAATFRTESKSLACPDCGGTCFITCMLFDGTQVKADCSLCTRGYLGPQGTVEYNEPKAQVELVEVTGVSAYPGSDVSYNYGSHYCIDEENLFEMMEEAEAKAQALADEYAQRQKDCLKRREKDTKSWAWHVRYHRQQIRDAEKSIAYHTAKLEFAKTKSKEPEAA